MSLFFAFGTNRYHNLCATFATATYLRTRRPFAPCPFDPHLSPPAHDTDLALPMSALSLEDFPYVPKAEHVSALDNFCELDHTLLQHASSPGSPPQGRKKSLGGETANAKGAGKKTSDKENVRRIMSGSYHAKTAASATPLRKKSRVFAVVGESGSGKTSLLQHWSKQRKLTSKTKSTLTKSPPRRNSDREDGKIMILPASHASSDDSTATNASVANEFIFTYFVKSSQDAQLSAMLSRLQSALKFHFQLRQLELRKTPSQLRWDLPRFLDAANNKARAPIIVIIDGLSRLRMHSGQEADPMLWMPRDLPNRVRFIVSLTEYRVPPVEAKEGSGSNLALHGPGATTLAALRDKTASYCELERRKSPNLRLGVLPLGVRRTILSTYAKFHRSAFDLSSEDMTQILASAGSGHPLYLRVLLNSLRTTARLSCIPAIAVGSLLDQCIDAQRSVVAEFAGSEREDRRRPSSPGSEEVTSLGGGGAAAASADSMSVVSSVPEDPPQRWSSVEMVISLALRCCEEDVEVATDGADKGLLGRVMSLLYVSHHGLTEDELLGAVALSGRLATRERRTDGGPTKASPLLSADASSAGWQANFIRQFEQHREVLRLILDDICMVVRVGVTTDAAPETEEVEASGAVHGRSSPVLGGAAVVNASETHKRSLRIIMEHEAVRRVVWRQYLGCSHEEKHRNHKLLATYFEEVVPVSPRRVQELPWHYERLGEHLRLRDTVVDISMFQMWWGDPCLEAYRTELIRVWSVLAAHPIGLDLVDEYRAAIESQVLSRGLKDDAVSELMLQVAELCVAFHRGGWEGDISAKCPPLKHPGLPLSELAQNGVPIVRHNPDEEESGEVRQFVDLLRSETDVPMAVFAASLGGKGLNDSGPLRQQALVQQQLIAMHKTQQVTPQTVELVREHYYYSRWLWVQFPIILLGFFHKFSERVATTAAAAAGMSPAASSRKMGSPKRKDPIVMHLRRLARKFENPPNDHHVVVGAEKTQKKAAIQTTPLRKGTKHRGKQKQGSTKKRHSPSTVFLTDDAPLVLDQLRENATTGRALTGHDETAANATTGANTVSPPDSNAPHLQQKVAPHPNAPFFLDVHAGDRHEKRIEVMKANNLKQRRVMNKMLINSRKKLKFMAKKKEELTVLNGLSKGEELSLTKAMNLVDNIESIGDRTDKVDSLSDFYKMVLLLTRAYPGNQAEWLSMLDEDIENTRKKAVQTRELITAIKGQGQDIIGLLNMAQTTTQKRRGVMAQMLDRMEFQHAKELANVRNEREWKQKQARLLRNDIENENKARLMKIHEESVKRQVEGEIKRLNRERKLSVWKARVNRLKETTGVSSIDEMFSIIMAGTQSSTEQNLKSLVSEHETKIQSLSAKKKTLRDEFMQLKFSSNRAPAGTMVRLAEVADADGETAPVQSFVKKELHQLTELELALGRSKLKIEQIKRELKRSNVAVTDVCAGFEHIIRMCGPTKDMDAESERENNRMGRNKRSGLYFEVSKDLSGIDRAKLALKRLSEVEGALIDKIANLQRLAPRTPKSRNRKLRRRSRSRQSKSRDGRVGSPLRYVLICSSLFAFPSQLYHSARSCAF